MNTQAHIIFNILLLRSFKYKPKFILATVIGAIIPDLAMFLFFAWTFFFQSMSVEQIFTVEYFKPHWQNYFDIYNSIPIFFIILFISFILLKLKFITKKVYIFMKILVYSALLHLFFDLFSHADDAHRHFYPFTNFVFKSPISYWDPDYFGKQFAILEILLVFISSCYIWKLFKNITLKTFIILVNLFNIVYIYFFLVNF